MNPLKQPSLPASLTSFEITKNFRKYGLSIGINTMKISGNMINKIYRDVDLVFSKAAQHRRERLLRSQLDALVLHLMRVYGAQDYQLYLCALDFEVEYYIHNGLRERDKIDHKVHGYSDPCSACGNT